MKPILACIGPSALRDTAMQLFREKKIETSINYYEASFETMPSIYEKLKIDKDIEVIIVISGPGFARYWKEAAVPVISIEVSEIDVLNALAEAKRRSARVVFMRHGSPIEGVEEYSGIIGLEIVSSFYQDREDAREKIKKFMTQGYNFFIGSGVMCEVVAELGGHAVCYYSRASLAVALENAWKLALRLRKESESRQQLNTIIEQAKLGIIAVNQQLICTLVNSEAEKMLGLNRDALVQKKLGEFWPLENVNGCLERFQSIGQIVEKVNQKKYLVDYNVIIVKKYISGIIITFQEVSRVHEGNRAVLRNLNDTTYSADYHFDDIIGSSKTIRRTVGLARAFAKSDSTVLITGESGTGKELFAQSIHTESDRRNKPFIAINCAALTESLLESELFGYEEGAFTGARKGGKAGLFEKAHEGSLYLDEISEISLNMQTSLLRVLQEKKIRRVGGSAPAHVDVRIIAATNRDLNKMVCEGTFRKDLYYRLNVLRLFIPPLRERIEDLTELINHFCHKYAVAQHKEAIIRKILEDSIRYPWPGNIRELENIVQRLVVAQRCRVNVDEDLLKQSIFYDLTTLYSDTPTMSSADNDSYELFSEEKRRSKLRALIPNDDILELQRQREKDYIVGVLEKFQGNRTRTAEYLGISRPTLWRKLNR